MSKYVYTAKITPQKLTSGEIDAESDQDAILKITRMGYFPVSVKPEDLSSSESGLLNLRKVSKKDVVFFTTQLSTLIESGVNIINGMNIIINQVTNKYFKSILNDVVAKIKDGRSLSASLAMYPVLFPDLYTSMIHSGEVGGNLELILKRLAEFLEKEEEFKNSVVAALTYPLFVIGVSVLTIVVLLTFVIPKLVGMFDDMGQALPLPTKILINISGFMREFWWLLLLAIIIFVFMIFRTNRTPQGKTFLDQLKLKTAIWGEIILKTEISRLMRTLSLLLASGVPVVSSLDISKNIVDNEILKRELIKFKEEITSGSGFSKCLNDSKLFPRFVTDIVTVGEETGTLEKGLLRIADDYEKDVDRKLKNMIRLLEPMIILVMGVIVAFIVVSMLLPIFQLNMMVK